MIAAIIPALAGVIGKSIDKAVPDKDQAEQLKAQITLAAMNEGRAELEGAVKIITAEAQGESWLQRNWRPTVMLTLTGLVVAHWLGWTAPNLPEDQVLMLLDIVKIGLGGYVVGRSAEKVVREYKKAP
jgi:hypothetical protein